MSNYIRGIQNSEGDLYKEFRDKQDQLKNEMDKDKRSLQEELYFAKFRKESQEIQTRRKTYKALLLDAKAQRQKLLDSRIIEQEHNELIRNKVLLNQFCRKSRFMTFFPTAPQTQSSS